jgi:hypothetical protein
MIEFYILLQNDNINNLNDGNLLGTLNTKQLTFWLGDGFKALTNIIDKNPEIMKEIKIINSNKKEYSVNDFLLLIETMKIKNTF